jgi:hypothetical protein
VTAAHCARKAFETRFRVDGTVCETVNGTAAMLAAVLPPPEKEVF